MKWGVEALGSQAAAAAAVVAAAAEELPWEVEWGLRTCAERMWVGALPLGEPQMRRGFAVRVEAQQQRMEAAADAVEVVVLAGAGQVEVLRGRPAQPGRRVERVWRGRQ